MLEITRFTDTVDDHAPILFFHIKIKEKFEGAFLWRAWFSAPKGAIKLFEFLVQQDIRHLNEELQFGSSHIEMLSTIKYHCDMTRLYVHWITQQICSSLLDTFLHQE